MKPLGYVLVLGAAAFLLFGNFVDSKVSPFGGSWSPGGGEPYVGAATPARPAQTGLVPTLILQDSYGVNHTLRTAVVPLSSVGEPTIPASRGRLHLSLRGYFEVDPSLVEKHGALRSWEVRGEVQPAISFSQGSVGKDGFIDLRGRWGYTDYHPYEMLAESDSLPSDAFGIYLSIDALTLEDVKNFIDVTVRSHYTNSIGIHDLRYTASGSLRLFFERETVVKSFSGMISLVKFEYTRDGQILFFKSAEIKRVTSEPTGLSVVLSWFNVAPKVRL